MANDAHVWRTPTERVELVERLIDAENRARLLERALREYAEVKDHDPSIGSFVAALLARIEVMERNQEYLLRQREAS